MATTLNKKVLNFNIGVLGHIDSGKTSLAKALSSTASTASFDKNPQSKERGITLDLGFSSFQVPLPEHLKQHPYDLLQFTLVDCPGHASLIRTIIGGAQIIDMMMLVVDVTKGMQTQTAECLVIGEILCEKMVVVLNKTDLLKEEKRDALIEKVIDWWLCKKVSFNWALHSSLRKQPYFLTPRQERCLWLSNKNSVLMT